MDQLLQATFGADHQRGIGLDSGLLDHLFVKKSNQVTLKNNVQTAFSRLQEAIRQFTSTEALTEKNLACVASWEHLDKLLKTQDFAKNYDACYFYTIEPLDKDVIASLLIGEAVSCCHSPTGAESEGLIERFASDASIPVVVQDDKRTVIAAAWCFLCKEAGSDELALVADFHDMKPSYTQGGDENGAGAAPADSLGTLVLEKLISFLPPLAESLGIGQVWHGAQAYGRLTGFDIFKNGTYEKKDFKIIGAEFMSRAFYSDNINPQKHAGAFSRLK